MASLSLTSAAAQGAGVTVDLDALALDDWALFGPGSSFTPALRKNGGGSTIAGAVFGSGAPSGYSGADNGFSWAGGSPAGSPQANAVYNDLNDSAPFLQAGQGGTFTMPAGTGLRRGYLWGLQYECVEKLELILSDGSAGPLVDTSLSVATGVYSENVYVFEYQTAGAATLTMRISVNSVNGISANVGIRGIGWKNLGGGSSATTATAAAGAATVSGAGRSTAATAGSAAAGSATVSGIARSTAVTTASAAAGSATVSAVGAGVTTTTASAAAGSAVVAANASATTRTAGQAAGAATVSALASSSAASTATPAAGTATVSAVGSTVGGGQTTAVPAAGVAAVSALASSIARTSAVPAAGSSTVSATASGGQVEETHGGGIDPAPFYRYTPPQKKKAHRERDWLDREEPVSADMGIPMSAPMATVERTTAADDALVALLLRSGLSLMQAQEQLAERMEAQRSAALIQMARDIALQDEDDIAALLLML